MDENKEAPETAETTESVPAGIPISKEINDFDFLIHTVIEYYKAKAGMKGELDEGEEWKEGTKYQKAEISKKVDDAVERAFLHQLKKFV